MPKKRRRSFLRFLWRRKVFIVLLLALAGIGWGSHTAIQAYDAHTERLAKMQEELNKVDFSKDPGRWIALQRELDFARTEPMLYGLMIAPLCAIGTVLIVSIIQASSSSRDHQPSEKWLPEMRAKREAHIQRNQER